MDITQIAIWFGGYFLALGEWRKDNIYRSIAGVCALVAMAIPDMPEPVLGILALVALYTAAMWWFQSSIRPKI